VYARTRITVAGDRVTVGRPEGGFTPPWRRVGLLLHGFGRQVTVDGAAVPAEQAGGAVRVVVDRTGGFTVQAVE